MMQSFNWESSYESLSAYERVTEWENPKTERFTEVESQESTTDVKAKVNTIELTDFAHSKVSSAAERPREVKPKCLQVLHDKDQDSEAILKTQSRSSRWSKIGSSLNIA